MRTLTLSFMLLSLGLALGAVTPSYAATSFEEVLSDKSYPLKRRLSDFDSGWRRTSIPGNVNVSGNTTVNVSGSSANSTSQNNNLIGASTSSRVYLTKGELVTVATRKFLVAYRIPSDSLDLPKLLQAAALKTPPSTMVLTPDSEARLCLLDLEHLSSLEDIQPFDLKREIAESEKARDLLQSILKAEAEKENKSKPAARAQ